MFKTILIAIPAAFFLSACSDPSAKQRLQSSVSASPAYKQNLAECRTLATEMPTEELRARTLKGAARGGVLGAVVADDGYNRAGAAAIGAVLVGGVSAATHKRELKKKRTEFVDNCMIARGQILVN